MRWAAAPSTRASARPPRPGLDARTLRLAVIGTLAGVFSGLFGVGGGSVIVPLLMLWLGYEERMATATSLAAIVFIAAFAAAVQGLYGNVRRGRRARSSASRPSRGVLIGTWLAQRVPDAGDLAAVRGACCVASAVELVLR